MARIEIRRERWGLTFEPIKIHSSKIALLACFIVYPTCLGSLKDKCESKTDKGRSPEYPDKKTGSDRIHLIVQFKKRVNQNTNDDNTWEQ